MEIETINLRILQRDKLRDTETYIPKINELRKTIN
jgi:hypothetical protein